MRLCISVLCLLLYSPRQGLASEFTLVPSDQNICSFDNATFHWKYPIPNSYKIQTIFFALNGSVFMSFDPTTGVRLDQGTPANRTSILMASHSEAVVFINDMKTGDSGEYQIILAGPGNRHAHQVSVLNEKELHPTLLVNNQLQQLNSAISMNQSTSSTAEVLISVQAVRNFTANLTISVNNKVATVCLQDAKCSYVLTPDAVPNGTYNILIQLDYGFCEIITAGFRIDMVAVIPANTDVPSSTTTAIIVTVVICVCLILGVLVVIVLWRKRKFCFKDTEICGRKADTVNKQPTENVDFINLKPGNVESGYLNNSNEPGTEETAKLMEENEIIGPPTVGATEDGDSDSEPKLSGTGFKIRRESPDQNFEPNTKKKKVPTATLR